jgi:hypothetical protein
MATQYLITALLVQPKFWVDTLHAAGPPWQCYWHCSFREAASSCMSAVETISATAFAGRQTPPQQSLTRFRCRFVVQLPPCWSFYVFVLPHAAGCHQRTSTHINLMQIRYAAFEMRGALAQKVCSAHATDPCACELGRSCTEPCAVFMTGAVVTTGLCHRLLQLQPCQRARRWQRGAAAVKGTWKSAFLVPNFRTKSLQQAHAERCIAWKFGGTTFSDD